MSAVYFFFSVSLLHLLCLGDIIEPYTPTQRIFFSVSPCVTAHIKRSMVNRMCNEFNQNRDL